MEFVYDVWWCSWMLVVYWPVCHSGSYLLSLFTFYLKGYVCEWYAKVRNLEDGSHVVFETFFVLLIHLSHCQSDSFNVVLYLFWRNRVLTRNVSSLHQTSRCARRPQPPTSSTTSPSTWHAPFLRTLPSTASAGSGIAAATPSPLTLLARRTRRRRSRRRGRNWQWSQLKLGRTEH